VTEDANGNRHALVTQNSGELTSIPIPPRISSEDMRIYVLVQLNDGRRSPSSGTHAYPERSLPKIGVILSNASRRFLNLLQTLVDALLLCFRPE
jgi:hypothetical protein